MTKETALALLGLILASSVLSALINQLGESIRQKRKRKYDTEDTETKELKAIKDGLKWVMFDKIRHLGLKYIDDGEVDFDERRILKEMHTSYHDGLGGNGDLDSLMESVYELPLKGATKHE